MKHYSFPFFCKYNNEKSYFRVESDRKFIELQIVGKQVMSYTIEAKQYPEMLRIVDMLELKDGMWIASSEEEFNGVLSRVQ